ncbi:E3 ubiquitin-protein ligase RNF126-B [Penaeus vannamei]|uniref:E3 ubiquitin-protein ligase RNF126-B n=1 Tax=Penaeus vannamei TaxID=6689 RepID=UPI00387F63D4
MAEAGVATASPSARFFCHKCNVEITPQLPEYVCPRCNSGFIEELERVQGSDSDSSSDMESEQYDMWEMISQDVSSTGPGGSGSSSASSSGPGLRRNQRLRHLNPRHGRRRVNGGDRHSALAPLIHDLIMQMTSGVIEASVGAGDFPGAQVGFDLPGFPVLVASNLASNPGDYAWGRGGLDAIITQLMNQLDGTGPPPLNRDQISQIPTVSITKEQFDQGLQCSVCMEDFKEDESVRRLHCEHCYHNDCIIPWLELHGTCPVCRKLLIEDGQFPHGGTASSASTSSNSSTGPGPRSSSSQAGPAASPPTVNSNASPASSSTSNNTPSSRSAPARSMFEDELD